MLRAIMAAFSLLVAVSTAAAPEPQIPVIILGQARVIDGDTIKIQGVVIRLYGIDAPESDQTCTKNGEPWRCGLLAALALEARIDGRMVACTAKDFGQHGRTVAVCHHDRAGDLNAWMVQQGYALAYRQVSTAYVAEEDEAREVRRGIWAGEFTPPWEWRAQQRMRRAPVASRGNQTAPRPTPTATRRMCCKVCRKGKPYGDTCISRRYTCHKGPGCAC